MSTLYTFVPTVKTSARTSSSMDNSTGTNDVPELSEESRLKLQKSREDFSRAIAAREDFEKNLKELSSPDTHHELAETPSAVAAVDENSLIPKSYEEIFSISVKNRMKNKEKKRTRDDEPVDESEAAAAAFPGDSTSHDFSTLKGQEYFTSSSAAPVETDVNSTLEFGAQIGWVKNAEHKNILKESYLREASEQQPSEGSEGGPGASSSSGISSSKAAAGGKSGAAGGGSAYASIEKKSNSSNNNSSKSYEYPKFTSSIGAMLPKGDNSSGSSGGGGGINTKRPSGKSHQQSQQPFRVKAEAPHNPYFSAMGQFEK